MPKIIAYGAGGSEIDEKIGLDFIQDRRGALAGEFGAGPGANQGRRGAGECSLVAGKASDLAAPRAGHSAGDGGGLGLDGATN